MQYYRDVIGAIAAGCGYTRILELGCQQMLTSHFLIRKWIRGASYTAVDVQRPRHLSGISFYQGTTDDFLEAAAGSDDRWDLIFIDADHSKEQVARDIAGSLKVLAEGGTIILHDMDPVDETFTAPHSCGDCFRLVPELLDAFQCVVLPVDEQGLAILRRADDRRALRW